MLNRIQLLCAVTGVLVVLTGGVEARAYEVVDHSGPVEANDTILETVGSQRVIAFFQRENGRCAVNAVVFEKNRRRHGHDHSGTCAGHSASRRDALYRDL